MELNHLKQNLYSRAVTPSVEGQLRHDGHDRGMGPESPSFVRKEAPDAVQRQRSQQVRRDEVDRRNYSEQSAQRRTAEYGHDLAGFSEATSFGDRLAVATRQARQTQSKRGYSSPALVSARGREANRRYLDASLSNQPRFIDELV